MTGKIIATLALGGALMSLTVFPTPAQAATLAVPGDAPTIAAALARAQPGDQVTIAPGTYLEHDLILRPGVSLMGTGQRPSDTTIDGQGQGRILLADGHAQSSIVANLTFASGFASGHNSSGRSGGAIFCSNSFLHISACVFQGNRTAGHGGAIRCNNSSPTLIGCRFNGNDAPSGGGGAIDCSFNSSPLIQDCTFRGNTAAWGGALSCRDNSSPRISSSLLVVNTAIGAQGYGGGVFADLGSAPELFQVTLVDNAARYGGALTCLNGADARLNNCTITGNATSVEGGGLFTFDANPVVTRSIISFQSGTAVSTMGTGQPVFTCTDIFGNSQGNWVGPIAPQLGGSNNLALNPLFCPTNSVYSLLPDSPCIDNGAGCGLLGAWSSPCGAAFTTIDAFTATWRNGHAHLAWQATTTGGPAPLYRITGALDTQPDNQWNILWIGLGNGHAEATDPHNRTDANSPHTYRLYGAEPDGTWSLLANTTLGGVPDFPGIRSLRAQPNPFNPRTAISFHIGHTQHTKVAVYNLSGALQAVLADRTFGPGEHRLFWLGQDRHGRRAASGTYIVLVTGSGGHQSLKISLLK